MAITQVINLPWMCNEKYPHHLLFKHFPHMNGLTVDSLHAQAAESMSHKVGIPSISQLSFWCDISPVLVNGAGIIVKGKKSATISGIWLFYVTFNQERKDRGEKDFPYRWTTQDSRVIAEKWLRYAWNSSSFKLPHSKVDENSIILERNTYPFVCF